MAASRFQSPVFSPSIRLDATRKPRDLRGLRRNMKGECSSRRDRCFCVSGLRMLECVIRADERQSTNRGCCPTEENMIEDHANTQPIAPATGVEDAVPPHGPATPEPDSGEGRNDKRHPGLGPAYALLCAMFGDRIPKGPLGPDTVPAAVLALPINLATRGIGPACEEVSETPLSACAPASPALSADAPRCDSEGKRTSVQSALDALHSRTCRGRPEADPRQTWRARHRDLDR